MGVFLRGAPGPRAAGAALGSALEAAQARPGWAEAPPAGPGRAYQPALPVGILTASAWRVAGRPHVSAHVAWLGFCYGLGWVFPECRCWGQRAGGVPGGDTGAAA